MLYTQQSALQTVKQILTADYACEENDDGIDPWMKGTNKVTYENSTEYYYDYCLCDETVFEYYCDGTDLEWYYLECEYGCVDGRCRKEGEVPEFSTIGAGLALIGAGFIYLKKKDLF